MFGIIKKMFIASLTSIVNASKHSKCLFLSNQKCEIQPTLINLHPNEYSQELHYYPFRVKLNKFIGICSTLTTYLTEYVFHMHVYICVKYTRF